MPLRAGELNKRVTLQTESAITETDAYLSTAGDDLVLDTADVDAFIGFSGGEYRIDDSSASAYLVLDDAGVLVLDDAGGSGGGRISQWTDTATLWAQIRKIAGGESFEAQQIASHLTHVVTIRYRTSVTPQQRLLYGSRVLKIRAIRNPGQRNERLELLCEEEDI